MPRRGSRVQVSFPAPRARRGPLFCVLKKRAKAVPAPLNRFGSPARRGPLFWVEISGFVSHLSSAVRFVQSEPLGARFLRIKNESTKSRGRHAVGPRAGLKARPYVTANRGETCSGPLPPLGGGLGRVVQRFPSPSGRPARHGIKGEGCLIPPPPSGGRRADGPGRGVKAAGIGFASHSSLRSVPRPTFNGRWLFIYRAITSRRTAAPPSVAAWMRYTPGGRPPAQRFNSFRPAAMYPS